MGANMQARPYTLLLIRRLSLIAAGVRLYVDFLWTIAVCPAQGGRWRRLVHSTCMQSLSPVEAEPRPRGVL